MHPPVPASSLDIQTPGDGTKMSQNITNKLLTHAAQYHRRSKTWEAVLFILMGLTFFEFTAVIIGQKGLWCKSQLIQTASVYLPVYKRLTSSTATENFSAFSHHENFW